MKVIRCFLIGFFLLTVRGEMRAAELFWFGGTPGAETFWDIQTSLNFSDSLGNPTTFFSGDQVVFDDLAQTNVVDLVGDLTPAFLLALTPCRMSFPVRFAARLSLVPKIFYDYLIKPPCFDRI